MLTWGQNLPKQTTFFLFDLTVSAFIHATKIWFVKLFFAPFFAKIFSEPLQKKAISNQRFQNLCLENNGKI